MKTTSLVTNEETLELFGESDNVKISSAIDRGYPIINGRAVPLVSIVLHEDGSCSLRVGHRWLHDLWPDPRLALLGKVKRSNGNGNGHNV
jgi:hypothetical protein